MYKLNACALCGKTGDIKLSHIIPKLVGRRLKKTSIGKIRNIENVNNPVQDIEKHYLLCDTCEKFFNKYETWFANNIFNPYLNKEKDDFDYDEHLHYFLTSLSWRSLYLDIMDFVQYGGIGIEALQCLIASEEILRSYLLNKRNDIGQIENHIFFYDRIQKATGEFGKELKPLHPHTSIFRSINSYTNCYENVGTFFTITNMMGLIVVTFYKKSIDEKWINTKVEIGKGNIKARNQYIASIVGNDLKEIMEYIEEQKSKLSENQKEIIKKRIKSVGNNIKNYDIFQNMIDDINLKNRG